jgi:LmbE family N-acetylglucosaminyl deacetylase
VRVWFHRCGSLYNDVQTARRRRGLDRQGGSDVRWVIVAHPDDELIFAGGAILTHADEPWTVVIATHEAGSPRAAESLAARDALRAQGFAIDYVFLEHTDEQWHATGGVEAPLMSRQLERLGVLRGERVYTHGRPGEYGHNGHRAVHQITTAALAGTAALSTFSGGDEVLERIDDPATLARKGELFKEAYPSQQGVWILLADMMREVMSEERHFAFIAAAQA